MLVSDNHQIGNNLYKIRKEAGLSQFEAASLAEISDRTYADIERGTTTMRVDTLCKICSALKITPDVILTNDSIDEDSSLNSLSSIIESSSERDQKILYQIITAYLKAIHRL